MITIYLVGVFFSLVLGGYVCADADANSRPGLLIACIIFAFAWPMFAPIAIGVRIAKARAS